MKPVYSKISGPISAFAVPSSLKLSSMKQIEDLVSALAAAKKLIRVRSVNSRKEYFIGYGFRVNQEQSDLGVICLKEDSVISVLQSGLYSILQQSLSSSNQENILRERGVLFSDDSPSMIYAMGSDVVIDFTNGIGKESAKILLRSEILRFSKSVQRVVDVPVTKNQFVSLVSLAHDIGEEEFSASNLVSELNSANYSMIPYLMQQWRVGLDSAGRELVVRQDLINRRRWEAQVFSTPDSVSISPVGDLTGFIEQTIELESRAQIYFSGIAG